MKFNKSLVTGPLLLAVLLMGCSSSTSRQSAGSDMTQASNSDSRDDENTPQSEGSCGSSSREKAIAGDGSFSCGNWDVKVSEGTLVPNDVIYNENMFNPSSDSKSWIAITVEATYNGEGKGDLDDVVASTTFLIGKNNLTYENQLVTGEEIYKTFGPRRGEAPAPYSGGTTKFSLWFWVDNSDSDFVLAMYVNDPYGDEPNTWVNVSADRS